MSSPLPVEALRDTAPLFGGAVSFPVLCEPPGHADFPHALEHVHVPDVRPDFLGPPSGRGSSPDGDQDVLPPARGAEKADELPLEDQGGGQKGREPHHVRLVAFHRPQEVLRGDVRSQVHHPEASEAEGDGQQVFPDVVGILLDRPHHGHVGTGSLLSGRRRGQASLQVVEHLGEHVPRQDQVRQKGVVVLESFPQGFHLRRQGLHQGLRRGPFRQEPLRLDQGLFGVPLQDAVAQAFPPHHPVLHPIWSRSFAERPSYHSWDSGR